MSAFERQIMGEIPLHEAAHFFIGVKQVPAPDGQVKSAAARMKSASQMMDGLLKGEMPEGKAGKFKPVSQIKEASTRMKVAATKLGFGGTGTPSAGLGDAEPNTQGGQPTPAEGNVPPADASMAPPQQPIQDPELAKPTGQPTLPVNYMGAEMLARQAQEANEVNFLRDRLNKATEQNNGLTLQLQQAQTQLDGLSQQSQAAGDQIAQAANEAVAASERALQHSMQAANMRMGIAKMREAMMELASQDPEALGTLSQQQQAQEQAQASMAGTPGQSPTPEAPPGSPAAAAPEAGGGAESGGSGGSSAADKSPAVQVKVGSGMPTSGALPGAIAGLGLAAIHGMRRRGQYEQDQQGVVDAEQAAQQDSGSFGKALDLAKARERLAESELLTKHPVRGNLRNMLGGVVGGAAAGTALGSLISTVGKM